MILAGAAAVLLTGAPATAQTGGGSVLVIGDSLQVGTGPYLEQELGAMPVESDDRQSRRSDEGLEALRARLSPEHTVVVFDMGTNDDPSNPDAFYANLQAARAATGDRCLVVATVLRPPYNGFSVEGMNAALERFALDNPRRPARRLVRRRHQHAGDPLRRRCPRPAGGLCAARPADRRRGAELRRTRRRRRDRDPGPLAQGAERAAARRPGRSRRRRSTCASSRRRRCSRSPEPSGTRRRSCPRPAATPARRRGWSRPSPCWAPD